MSWTSLQKCDGEFAMAISSFSSSFSARNLGTENAGIVFRKTTFTYWGKYTCGKKDVLDANDA